MLKSLHIRNFALVEELELEFDVGMTVLTGETGAGKSILLGALGLCLGDRADSTIVRHGSPRAEIAATFATNDIREVEAWLVEHDLDLDDGCIIRRTVSSDGRSRAYINGQPAPIQLLKELGEQLVDLHSQHAHQSLLKRTVQRQRLDGFAKAQGSADATADAFAHWQRLIEERQLLAHQADERRARLDLIGYQVEELHSVGLLPGEAATLDEEFARLANAQELQQGALQALTRLYESDDQSLVSLLESTLSELQHLANIDAGLSPSCELLDAAAIQAKEASSELRHYLEAIELDPQRLQEVDERLVTLHELARKHRVEVEALPAVQQQLEQELEQLHFSEGRLDTLDQNITVAEQDYQKQAQMLSKLRLEGAQRLELAIENRMHELGMEQGRFEIALSPCEPSPHGLERVDYRVSVNPGQPVQSLTKVASGGELSRISLAIQVICADQEGIPTLIFDEVDVGVGGGTAEMVGRQLRLLSSGRQVLCVTHQPQVASQGHHHLRITKLSSDDSTFTQVERLAEAERITEVARMLGGVDITRNTLSHAKEMIALAKKSS